MPTPILIYVCLIGYAVIWAAAFLGAMSTERNCKQAREQCVPACWDEEKT